MQWLTLTDWHGRLVILAAALVVPKLTVTFHEQCLIWQAFTTNWPTRHPMAIGSSLTPARVSDLPSDASFERAEFPPP